MQRLRFRQDCNNEKIRLAKAKEELKMLTKGKSKRSASGKRYRPMRPKKQYEKAGIPSLTAIQEKKIQVVRKRGGQLKFRMLASDTVNLLDKKTKKFVKAKIKTVVDNPANQHYVRRNIMTKGAIIETDKGKARITSRPGQDGMINAVLVQ